MRRFLKYYSSKIIYTILKYKYEKRMEYPGGILFHIFRKFKCDEYKLINDQYEFFE